MFLQFEGESYSRKILPASTPQGAFLGILLFIIIFNGALLRPRVPRPDSLTLKYVDDLSVLQALNLKTTLREESFQRPFPLSFNERTMNYLPSEANPLQQSLLELEKFTVDRQMRIKEKKTTLMKYNSSLKYDFPPELKLDGFKDNIVVVKETRLLGIFLTDDLKWMANTNHICANAYKKYG